MSATLLAANPGPYGGNENARKPATTASGAADHTLAYAIRIGRVVGYPEAR